jgi:threonine dehydratase
MIKQMKMEKLIAPPNLSQIQETHEAIKGFIHKTPVLTCAQLDNISGAQLFFKCENFQKIGAFKMRGAINTALRLSEEEKQAGLATHSSGNHAQAVSLSAKLMGIPAHIVMPDVSPSIKVAATKGYGANVYFCENNQQDREDTLAKVQEKTRAAFIHPYDDYNVIAGQATASKELLEEIPGLDIVMAPIGGGGLMSGTALTTKFLSSTTKVYGAEPKIVDDAWRSFTTGQLQKNTSINTIADGLRTNLSERTFGIIKEKVDDIFTVSEEQIMEAMLLVYERMKIVIEPSSAVPLAAVLANPEVFKNKKTGIIISGGNVDLKSIFS